MQTLTPQDAQNRSTWSRASSRRWLDALLDDIDPGERVAIDLIRDEVRGKPILDLGVGTGRTIPLLAPLASEYRGVDYLESMVAACRARHPNMRVDLGDARALVDVPSRHFGLVVFSFNGIDAVAHDDRRRVLAEMRRVLRDDGIALFSSLNIDGPAFRERPWQPRAAHSHNRFRRAVRVARAWASVPFDFARWAQLRKRNERGEGWALAPLSAHHYGVLVHFTTRERQLTELREAGFSRDVVVIENEIGANVTMQNDTSASSWFHFIARAT